MTPLERAFRFGALLERAEGLRSRGYMPDLGWDNADGFLDWYEAQVRASERRELLDGIAAGFADAVGVSPESGLVRLLVDAMDVGDIACIFRRTWARGPDTWASSPEYLGNHGSEATA